MTDEKRNLISRFNDAISARIKALRPKAPAKRAIGLFGGSGGYSEAAQLADYYETRTIPRTATGLAAAFTISVWAYRATSVRARMVGSIPWHIRRLSDDEIVSRSTDISPLHPAARAIKAVRKTQDFGLFELWEYSLCIWGENYIEKVRTALPYAYPVGLWWMNPTDVTPFAPYGRIESLTYLGTDGRVAQLDHDQFIQAKLFNPIDFTGGVSPLEVALTDINVEANSKAFAKTFFRNNARPGLVFFPKSDGDVFTSTQIEQMRRLINEQWSGVNNAGKPQILNAPVDVKTLDMQSLDDQALANERLSRDILAAFGVPRSLAGDTDSATYKANDDVMQWFIETTIMPECVMIADSVNLSIMPFFDESCEYQFEFDFSKFERITDADKARQELNAQRLSTTAMTLYDYQKASGIEEPAESFKDLYKVEGINGFIPGSEIPNIWKYTLLGSVGTVFGSQVAAAGIGLDVPDSALSADQLAASQAQEAAAANPIILPALVDSPVPAPNEPQRAGRGLCVALDLADNPDLMSLQTNVKRLLGDAPATYRAPDSFHVTLAFAPSIAPELFDSAIEAVTAIPVPELSLGVGSLNSFDKVGEHAVHFRIRQNSALRDYQASVYEALSDLGIGLSAYSEPLAWKPHITMVCTADKQRVTFHSSLSVKPSGIIIWDENEAVTYRTTDAQAEADEAARNRRALTEFEAYANYVRKGKQAARAFTWSEIDDDTAYLLRADLEVSDSAQRGLNIVSWRSVMSARAGIAPDVLTDDIMGEYTRAYRDVLRGYGVAEDDIVPAVRAHWLTVNSRRAVSREQSRFEQAALILFRRAQKERFTQIVFEGELYSLIAGYIPTLMIAGYADGGVGDHELTPRDESWVAAHLIETRGRISNVATAIYVDGVVSDNEITGKPRMWWNLSANPAYNEGLARASKSALGQFRLGETELHCRDCAQLNNLVFPFSVWFNYFGRELPPCNATECGGYRCKCKVVTFVGKASKGTPPRLFGGSGRSMLEFEEGLPS